ncbi:flavin reductase family protein [Nocardia asiatica]|uniref:flavin reductase family protein n=1 Tax=Nocardia asiatica TaxID=209252 RepID=UPI0006844133|nr:flavin reductase family protein [Nocardia asiatica]
MASVCTPVSVITAMGDGLPYGTTVSAFASLSMTPPMVLVSLDRASRLLTVIRETEQFGVNVLSSGQAGLAGVFATKSGTDKFAGVEWFEETSVPRLPEATGFLSCTATQFVDGGDHVVVLGAVRAAEHAVRAPLTYHRRIFGTHAALSEHAG